MTQAAPVAAPRRAVTLPLAAFAGAATVPGFAPFHLFPLPIITLALLIVLWQRAASRSAAALVGLAFGLAYFLAGVSWVYVSLHDFGAMPAPLAAVVTVLFCCYLALYPAAVGWLYHRLDARSSSVTLLALPALWALTEWLRGWLFTGFPWLALGYAQVPDSPLAGYAPVLGVYGVTFATVVSAGLIVVLWTHLKNEWPLTGHWGGKSKKAGSRETRQPGDSSPPLHPSPFTLHAFRFPLHPALVVLVALWAGGFALQQIDWTRPEGDAVSVSLLQGNIPQEMKWRADRVRSTLDTYRNLVTATDARLVILPETALPLFYHDIPQDYLDSLAAHARKHRGDILIGVPERGVNRDYFNSVLSFGSAPTQTYRKSHLVPFGEFVPLKPLFGWFIEAVSIPLLDFTRGADAQPPLAVAGQRVAINICYEDAFGEEIIRQLPQATLLVNVSNVAWFGRSVAPQQHLQISQARAIETGRTMLRATNTGMTAIIDPHGRVQQVAPEFTTAIVSAKVQGYTGATPYVRWGNLLIIVLSLLFAGASSLSGLRLRQAA